jgi:hypothetical protein
MTKDLLVSAAAAQTGGSIEIRIAVEGRLLQSGRALTQVRTQQLTFRLVEPENGPTDVGGRTQHDG